MMPGIRILAVEDESHVARVNARLRLFRDQGFSLE